MMSPLTILFLAALLHPGLPFYSPVAINPPPRPIQLNSINIPVSRLNFWQSKSPSPPSAEAETVPTLSDLKTSLLSWANEYKVLQREYFLDKEANKFTERYGRLQVLEGTIIELCEKIGAEYPPINPFQGWKDPDADTRSPLDGRWSLRFTTAADATFKPNEKLGNAATSQRVCAETGYFINEIDFDGTGTSKVKGFRVFVEGKPRKDEENVVDLKFRKVQILRDSRFPKLFGSISLRIPTISSLSALSALFRISSGVAAKRPSKKIVFVDDDMRIHKSSEGKWFVQSKLANRI